MGLVSADSVFQYVRNRIISGEYGDGQRITESEIALELGLSRTPVREGLHRLQAAGLVTIKPNAGATVTFVGERELFDLLGVRALLEGHAAAGAATRASDEQIEDLGAIALRIAATVKAEESDHAAKVATVAQMNVDFHSAVVKAAANSTLEAALQPLIQVALASRAYGGYKSLELERSSRHHLEIAEAIRDRDAERANSLMFAHLLSSRRSMIS